MGLAALALSPRTDKFWSRALGSSPLPAGSKPTDQGLQVEGPARFLRQFNQEGCKWEGFDVGAEPK